MTRPEFRPKQKPTLFSGTKFSDTETKTFFPDKIFWNRDFFPTQISQNQNRDFFRDQIFRNRNPPTIGKSLKIEAETGTSEYLEDIHNLRLELLRT